MAANRVIGHNNTIPWHIPADLLHFKELTMGHALIMGRKTYESIGRPLPGRLNIIISRQPDLAIAGYQTVPNLEIALEQAAKSHNKIFIIGGGEIFRISMAIADTIYLTQLQRSVEGDIVFPELSADFNEVSSEMLEAEEPLLFTVYTKNRG